jgi:hypothetical protein
LWNYFRGFVERLGKTVDCDPTLDLFPSGLGLARSSIKGGKALFKGGKAAFKSADAVRRSNKQVRDALKELGFRGRELEEAAEILHRDISKEGLSYREILQRAKDLFGK